MVVDVVMCVVVVVVVYDMYVTLNVFVIGIFGKGIPDAAFVLGDEVLFTTVGAPYIFQTSVLDCCRTEIGCGIEPVSCCS